LLNVLAVRTSVLSIRNAVERSDQLRSAVFMNKSLAESMLLNDFENGAVRIFHAFAPFQSLCGYTDIE